MARAPACDEVDRRRMLWLMAALRCRFGLHRWKKRFNHETSSTYKGCTECGKRMGTGWPQTGGWG